MNLHQKICQCLSAPEIEYGIAIHHIESGEETLINADALFPTASVFKVPVMVEVFKQVRQGRFALTDRLPLLDSDKTLPSGILYAMQAGLQPTIQDLLVLMIIISDNVATGMLLRQVGAENVTQTMHALGFTNTHVTMDVHRMFLEAMHIAHRPDISIEELFQVAQTVPMDLHTVTFDRTSRNNVSSARDMAHLMKMIYQGEVVDRQACDQMLLIMNLQQYNKRVPRYVPWFCYASKGGTLRGVRNDSGLIYCSPHSHVAYSIFSLDSQPMPFYDLRVEVRREFQSDEIMANIGEAIYLHYGGKYGAPWGS